jgi:drug/metabolite transporter (DMT)-like permease
MAGFYRTLFGGIILTIIVLVGGERIRRGFTSLKQALVAALLFALGLTFWHRSIMAVGPGLSTILANFQVFFLSAMGIIFLKERLRLRTAVAIPLAIIGIYLLVGEERFTIDLSYRTGVVFGLLAALAYALYLMALRNLQAGKKTSAQMANFALVSLTCAAIMGVEGWWQGESFAIMDLHSWLSMMAYGVLCQALAWILISAGLPRIEASRAGLILLLQPTGAFVWDILFFGRPTTGLEFCGAGLTLAAIYIGTAHK